MSQTKWLWIGLGVWVVVYAASFLVAYTTAPTGDSFLRGVNRLMVFFQFQIAAGVIGIVVWYQGRAIPRGTAMRWLSRVPVFMATALFLTIVGLILYANFGRPVPSSEYVPNPAKPITAPAEPLNTD